MKVLSELGIPDLDVRGFTRQGQGMRLFKDGGGGGSAPPVPATPDYVGAANATAQGNLEAAKYAAQANRVNQVTPWGSLTWSTDRTFDQEGYDRAQAAYQQQLDALLRPSQQGNMYTQPGIPPAPNQSAVYGVNPQNGRWGWSYGDTTGDSGGTETYWRYADEPFFDQMTGQWYNPTAAGYGATQGGLSQENPYLSSPAIPNPEDFYRGGDQWTQTVNLSPEMQALFDQEMALQSGLFGAQNAALGRVNSMMGSDPSFNSLNPGSLPDLAALYDPDRNTNNAAELLMRRMNPELDRQSDALRAQLANQGILQGSTAYDREMARFGQQRNDALTQAQLHGINLGMQQQGQTFGQSLQARQLAAALQGQQFSQDAYMRNLPINELNALRSGNQVGMPQFPGFTPMATVGGADILGATQATHQGNIANYEALLGASNAGAARQSNMMSGLFGVGGGLLGGYFGGAQGAMAGAQMGSGLGGMFSDRRLKRDVRRVGTADNGLPIYSYRYVWGGPAMLGFMADEVEQVAPHAVGSAAGFKTVDYGVV